MMTCNYFLQPGQGFPGFGLDGLDGFGFG